jgi:hypothetical protein
MGYTTFYACCIKRVPSAALQQNPIRLTTALGGWKSKKNRCFENHLCSRDQVSTRWFKHDRDKLWLVYTQSVPVIFEPPCMYDIGPRRAPTHACHTHMEQCSSLEADSSSAAQDFFRVLWNPSIHYCIHKNPLVVLILSRWVSSTPSNPISLKSILMLSSHLR